MIVKLKLKLTMYYDNGDNRKGTYINSTMVESVTINNEGEQCLKFGSM